MVWRPPFHIDDMGNGPTGLYGAVDVAISSLLYLLLVLVVASD